MNVVEQLHHLVLFFRGQLLFPFRQQSLVSLAREVLRRLARNRFIFVHDQLGCDHDQPQRSAVVPFCGLIERHFDHCGRCPQRPLRDLAIQLKLAIAPVFGLVHFHAIHLGGHHYGIRFLHQLHGHRESHAQVGRLRRHWRIERDCELTFGPQPAGGARIKTFYQTGFVDRVRHVDGRDEFRWFDYVDYFCFGTARR